MSKPRVLSYPMAMLVMVCSPLLFSMAGVVTRHLEAPRGFEITFWRSLSMAIFMAMIVLWRGKTDVIDNIRKIGWIGVLSGIFWAMLFTCFMMSLTLTTVANTLIVDSIVPFLTAVSAWIFLRQRTPLRTWFAIALASSGIVWMFLNSAYDLGSTHLLGMTVALGAPVAATGNFIILKKAGRELDLIPAVFLGGVFSCLFMLPLAWPFQSSLHDIGIMAGLGVFQLSLPCICIVMASRTLSAPEMSLIGMLEIVLGPLWAWLGAGEVPAQATLIGGAFVLLALVLNEVSMLRQLRRMQKGLSARP